MAGVIRWRRGEVFGGFGGVLGDVGRDPFGRQLAGRAAVDRLCVGLGAEPQRTRVAIGYNRFVGIRSRWRFWNSRTVRAVLVLDLVIAVVMLAAVVEQVWTREGQWILPSLGYSLACLGALADATANRRYLRARA